MFASVESRVICDRPELMREAIVWLNGCELISVDIETIPHITKAKKPQPEVITVVSYTGISEAGVVRSYAFQLTKQKSSLEDEAPFAEKAMLSIERINRSSIRKTLHNGVYDAAWFLRYAVPLKNYAYDSMTLWWSRYPDLPKTLDYVSSIVLDSHAYWKQGRKDEDFTAHTYYAMNDTETTLFITLRLIEWAIADPAMAKNFSDAHMRCLSGLGMTMRGMLIDSEVRTEMHSELAKSAEEKLARLRYILADEDFNPNSTPAKKAVFYDLLGLPVRNAKGRVLTRVTGNAKPSTGAIALRAFKSDHPIAEYIVNALDDAMQPAKQISNVIGIEFRGTRFHTGYDGVGTTTTRFSSRKDAFNYGGNGQNIRKKYRRFLRADPDSIILEVDFSAADDVFVSYESEEPKKIAIIERGLDTHSFNASEVFFTDWDYDRVVAGKREYLDAQHTILNPDYPLVTHPITGIRQITKKTTHGANYLMAGMTLLMSAGRAAIVGAAKALGHVEAGKWDVDELCEFCEFLDAKYRRYYPRFARTGSGSFYADLAIQLRSERSFLTVFGYRQYFSGDPYDDRSLRALAATVGQANTAGRVNMALAELDHGVRINRFRDGEAPDADEPALPINEQSHGASIRLQTHDSLTFNIKVTHPNWREGIERIFHVMRRPVIIKKHLVRVGLEADVSIHWASRTETVDGVSDIEKFLAEAGLAGK